jgi:hypothetical protein
VFKKAARFALLFLAGVGLGLFAGWKHSSTRERLREGRAFGDPKGRDFLKTYDLVARLRTFNLGSAMRIQDPKDSPQRRRESLNLILETAQEGRASVSDPATLTLIDVETGITDVRLSMLEGDAGDLPTSQAWMQKAQSTLKQAGWKDYSEEHLKTIVQALNKQDSCDTPCSKK